jgi:hypothetical protein
VVDVVYPEPSTKEVGPGIGAKVEIGAAGAQRRDGEVRGRSWFLWLLLTEFARLARLPPGAPLEVNRLVAMPLQPEAGRGEVLGLGSVLLPVLVDLDDFTRVSIERQRSCCASPIGTNLLKVLGNRDILNASARM